MAVFAQHALVGGGADTGIVDEHIQPIVVQEDRLAEAAHLVERREIRSVEARTAFALAFDLRHERHPPLAIPAVHDDVGAAGGEPARDLAAESGFRGYETLARCELACLPGGDAKDGLCAFTENEDRLDAEERLAARYLLWKATGDRAHLEEAKRLLDESVAHVDDAMRASMLMNLRGNREIMAAWEEHGAGD